MNRILSPPLGQASGPNGRLDSVLSSGALQPPWKVRPSALLRGSRSVEGTMSKRHTDKKTKAYFSEVTWQGGEIKDDTSALGLF